MYKDIDKLFDLFMYYKNTTEIYEKALKILFNKLKLFPFYASSFDIYRLEICNFDKIIYLTKEEYEILNYLKKTTNN